MEVLPAVPNRALVPELQAGSCPGGEAGMAHFLPSWYRFYIVLRASRYSSLKADSVAIPGDKFYKWQRRVVMVQDLIRSC